jgi:diadenosine tetraphosphate (Ap4A) HIT family hydrolase
MSVVDDPWGQQEAGVGCYLCLPRLAQHAGIQPIAALSVSSLYLLKEQRYRGESCLVLNVHVTRLDALDEHEYSEFMRDLRRSVHAIRTAVAADHMNLTLLGNSCPHLHWGIVPRRRGDPRWGRPSWDDAVLEDMRVNPTTLSEAGYSDLVASIRQVLQSEAP